MLAAAAILFSGAGLLLVQVSMPEPRDAAVPSREADGEASPQTQARAAQDDGDSEVGHGGADRAEADRGRAGPDSSSSAPTPPAQIAAPADTGALPASPRGEDDGADATANSATPESPKAGTAPAPERAATETSPGAPAPSAPQIESASETPPKETGATSEVETAALPAALPELQPSRPINEPTETAAPVPEPDPIKTAAPEPELAPQPEPTELHVSDAGSLDHAPSQAIPTAQPAQPVAPAEPRQPASALEPRKAEVKPAAEQTPTGVVTSEARQSAPTTKVRPAAKALPAEGTKEAATPQAQAQPKLKPLTLGFARAPAKPAKGGISARAYAGKVHAAIARNRLGMKGAHGNATVTFSIGPAGGIQGARISRSSGKPQLDQAALASVRNAAPFPPPPQGAKSTYSIQIYFR